MSQPRGAVKRKRPESDSKKDVESLVYDLIKSKGDEGIWKGDVKKVLNVSNLRAFETCIKNLLKLNKIKEVEDIQARGKKRLMAIEFEPSSILTGGVFYDNGSIDKDMINGLKQFIIRTLSHQKVATADGLLHVIKKSRVLCVPFTLEELKQFLDNMILEKEIIKVKSNGIGEFAPFPINADCYKVKPQRKKVGALASVPCGVCPRINQCTPDGIISPSTCVYYAKWLDF